ncbi:hypothetical protein [Herpetosiphon llansteffanensis]|uniref:hypothetical protein n=1 Tax=Herpetosiphon llansteffanensis TaxID=2094568 RepID=UPI000D7C2AB7|nr:hypothetical protein [Herpetosiphon llansteffanensis]
MSTSMMNKHLKVDIHVTDVEDNTLGAMQTATLIQDIDTTLENNGYKTDQRYNGSRSSGLLELVQAVQDNQEMLRTLANLSTPIVAYLLRKFPNKPQHPVITYRITTSKQQKSVPILKNLSEDELLQLLLELDPENSHDKDEDIHVTVEIAVPTNIQA